MIWTYVQIFVVFYLDLSPKSQIQKSLKYPIGGGSSLFGTLSQIFPFLDYDASPNKLSDKVSLQLKMEENKISFAQ